MASALIIQGDGVAQLRCNSRLEFKELCLRDFRNGRDKGQIPRRVGLAFHDFNRGRATMESLRLLAAAQPIPDARNVGGFRRWSGRLSLCERLVKCRRSPAC